MNMSEAKPRFLGTTLLYFTGTVLAKAAVFLLLPLYTAKIPAAELGSMDVHVAVAVFAASVILLDMGVAILRFYLQAEGERAQHTVLTTGLCLLGMLALLYLLLALVLSLLYSPRHFWLAVLYGLSNTLLLAAGHVARAVGARVRYVLSGLVAALLQVALALLLVLLLDMGVRGLYLAYIVGALCGCLVAFSAPALRRAPRMAKADGKLLGVMLRFALPLGASAAAFLMLSSLSRIVTFYWLGSAAAGHLAVALKFSQIILLVSACFQLVWQELALAGTIGKENIVYFTARADLFLRVALVLLLLLIPCTSLFLTLFPRFLGAEYEAVRGLLPAAFLFFAFQVMATFFEPILAKYGKTGSLLLTTLAGALLHMLLTALVLLLGGGAVWLLAAAAFSFLAVLLLRILLLIKGGVLLPSLWRHLLLLLPLGAVVAVYYLLAPVWQAVTLTLMCLFAMAVLLPEALLLITRLFNHKK